MKKKQRWAQLILISIGLFLFVVTYLYYPNMYKDKVIESQTVQKDSDDVFNDNTSTSFKNVTYQGLTSAEQKFSIKAKSAYVLDENPELVFMKNMKVEIYLNDGRIVRIRSDLGRYHKESHDTWFEENVIADDGDTKIFAENLDLLATKNYVEIYNDVYLDYTTGNLVADKIDYNFETKNFKVSMFDDKKIKAKVIQ